MEQLFISLRMDLSSTAPDGAGWYIQVGSDEGKILDPLPISPEGAVVLAGAFQTALQSTDGELPNISIPQIAQVSSAQIADALRHQLQYAEEQASKIGKLRKKLALVPPKSD